SSSDSSMGRNPALAAGCRIPLRRTPFAVRLCRQEESHMMLVLSRGGLRWIKKPSVPARRPSAGARPGPRSYLPGREKVPAVLLASIVRLPARRASKDDSFPCWRGRLVGFFPLALVTLFPCRQPVGVVEHDVDGGARGIDLGQIGEAVA